MDQRPQQAPPFRAHTDSGDEKDWPLGGGELGELIRAFDWSRTSLGPISGWPQCLKTATDILLRSPVAIILLWGEDGVMIYNDAYSAFAGGRHPEQLGMKVREGWPEVADFNDNVMKVGLAGGTLAYKDQELTLYRTGRAEQVWMDLDYSPVVDEVGRPAGVLAIVIETTPRVHAERSLRDERDRSRGVLDGMAEGFALLDREFRILDVNREAMRLETRAREDIVGRTHWDAYPGTERSELGRLYRRAMAERVPVSLEHHHRWEDGREAWIEMRAYPVEQGLAVFYRDITARKAGEAALRESEARFRDIANSIDQMVWSTRPDGFHDFYNQRWYEFTGVPEGSTDGEAWNGMFHPDDQDRAWARWRQSLVTGEPYEIEYRLRHRSGAYRWVLGRANAVRDEAGRITRWYGTCTDVHDQRLAAEALRRSEQSLRDLNADLERRVVERSRERGLTWQITPDLIGVCNAEGYFESSNPAWQSVLGWSEEEVRTTPFSHFLHPHDIERTSAAFEQLTRGMPLLRFENRYRTKDGSRRWLSWVAVPEGGKFYCSARDITAEKEQEAELAARTTERDRLWRNTQDIQVVIDGDGTFQNVNPAFTRTLGWNPEQAIGCTVFDFVMPDDEAPTGGALAHARNDALPIFENRYRHRDGGFRWISWVAAPEGELIYASGRNITAEKEQAAELATAQEALRQSQKMEAVGQLTGGIAHDFNNMLAVVIGSLDLLGRRLGTADPRSKRYLDAAADGARRAALLTQRLLAFSRQQPLRPEALDVNRLVSGMSELVRGSMGSDVRLETVLGGGVWRTHADPNQLENVILNLAVNARDAMPEGGRLTIETQNAHLDARYVAAHLGVPAGQYVLIAVTDTGTGMPPEVIAKAFDPFFTTKEVGKGTGLGLSQVYGFVKQSGGHVKIYSEPGQGTTIKIYLPRLIGVSVEAGKDELAPDLPLGDLQETILVVEDEPAVRQFSVDALVELGYRALEADGAAAALRLLEAHPEIALLFTDVVMPDVNGAKLAEEARRPRPDLKVLFTTGYTRNAIVHNGVLDPGVEIIGKPFTIEELAARLREVLDAPSAALDG